MILRRLLWAGSIGGLVLGLALAAPALADKNTNVVTISHDYVSGSLVYIDGAIWGIPHNQMISAKLFVDWGDGTIIQVPINVDWCSGIKSAKNKCYSTYATEHTYSAPGIYNVGVYLTSFDAPTGSPDTSMTFVVN